MDYFRMDYSGIDFLKLNRDTIFLSLVNTLVIYSAAAVKILELVILELTILELTIPELAILELTIPELAIPELAFPELASR
jgi:hypothetical protein